MKLEKITLDRIDLFRDLSIRLFYETFKDTCASADMETYLKSAFDREKMSAELQNPCFDFFFLYSDDNLTGYLKLNEAPAQTDINDGESLEIERIYVD